MNIKKNSLIRVIAIIVTLVLLLSISVSASESSVKNSDIPYDTFVYYDKANTSKAVQVRGMYDFDRVLDSNDLGISKFESLTDLSVDVDDNLYLLDGTASKIYVLNPEYELIKTIDSIVGSEESYKFDGANGFVVSRKGEIYIADTEHARVLVSDLDGNHIDTMYLPDSTLIPDEFNFRPIKIAVDSSGYVYVLSDGSYYGAILYSDEGEFLGFYGANTVATSITQVLQTIWNKIIMTNERHAYTASKLPYQFTDLYADKADFIYTATGATSKDIEKGQIKRLSPGGENILESTDVTFGITDAIQSRQGFLYPDMAGVAVNDDGFIFTYDSTSGYIFVYDGECNMLNGFSGGSASSGDQDGNFRLIKAIDVNSKSNIFVIDSLKLSLTVFTLNDFGKSLMEADVLTIGGDYTAALPIWEKIISQDRNCQLAYSGIARSYLQQEDYKTSMEYAKQGFDTETYSSAFEYVRRDYLDKNLTWIFIVLIVLVVLLILWKQYKKSKGIVLIKNDELKLLMNVTFHPSDVFNEVKQKKKGSIWISIALIIIYYISATVKQTASGFLFKPVADSSFNSLLVLLQTLGAVLLFAISNWAVCTLMDGKGKMKEIFIVTSYALVPLIISNIVYTVLSHVLTSEEKAFVSIIVVIFEILAALILIFGVMIIHDYTFGKFVGTTILTVLGMLIILFLLISIFILVQQLWAFLGTLIREIFFR